MTEIERRLEVIRLAKPINVSIPDMGMWIAMANQIDAWILAGAGHPSKEALQEPDKPTVIAPARKLRPGG